MKWACVVVAVGGCGGGVGVVDPSPRRDTLDSVVVMPSNPDPDYPRVTPPDRSVDEPDRGPSVPITFAVDRSKLAWTTHAHCEDDAIGFACSSVRPSATAVVTWRVGRATDVVVVDKLRAGAVDETFVHVPGRRVHIDSYDRVVSSAQIAAGDTHYRMRTPSGKDALDGCGMMDVVLDRAGRIAISRCLSWRGGPRLDKDRVAMKILARDADGFVIDEVRADFAGRPIDPLDGVSRIAFTRAATGHVDLIRNFDGATDTPLADRSGCIATKLERDTRDVELRQTCLGSYNEPTASHSRGAIETFAADARGCRLETRTFAFDGITPFANPAHVHAWIQRVDEHCAPTRITCADYLGDPIACGPGQPARINYDRDVFGRETAHQNYDTIGRPAPDRETSTFEVRSLYDDKNLTNRICFGINTTLEDCGSTGYNAEELAWDSAGHVAEVRFLVLDVDLRERSKITSARHRYDSYDRDVETQYHDAYGNPAPLAGATQRNDRYDANGDRSAILMFNGPGIPTPADFTGCYPGAYCPLYPWHAVKIDRKPDGTVVTNTFFGSNGKRLAQTDCKYKPCFD